MHEVAIIGAGELGGLTAQALAQQHAAGTIRLIDDHGRVAEGKALDITQSAAVEGFATELAGGTDFSAVAGASIVVIADQAGGAEWSTDEGLRLVRRVHSLAPRATVLCAGASYSELVGRSVSDLKLPRTQILGSAPEGYVAAAAAVVALELDLSPADVALAILGVPPGHVVIAWEHASAAGIAVTSRISEPVRHQLTRKIGALWPMGPRTLAAAACKVTHVLSGRTRRAVTCFVAPDEGAGARTRTAAVPVRLDADGLIEVVMPALTAGERVALDNAMLL
jgi:malate dehydrogenase